MIATPSPEAVCAACGNPFHRYSTTQRVCRTYRCASKIIKADKKAERDNTRARRIALMSPRDWLAAVQKALNEFIRWRDRGLPCISCRTPWEPTFQAGHYLSRGARPELRFELKNLAGQCVKCNLHLHGNQAMYRIGLVEREGLEVVEALEGPHPTAKWPLDELKTMRAGFKLLTKQAKEAAADRESC